MVREAPIYVTSHGYDYYSQVIPVLENAHFSSQTIVETIHNEKAFSFQLDTRWSPRYDKVVEFRLIPCIIMVYIPNQPNSSPSEFK